MEFRQILTVALFMMAAAIMKNAVPGPVDPVSEQSMSHEESVSGNSEMLVAAIVPDNLLLQATSEAGTEARQLNSEHEGQLNGNVPVPGSIIALVVAALSLVSVARRDEAASNA